MTQPGYGPAAGERHQGDLTGDARLEPHRGAGRLAPPPTARRPAGERERVVGLGEVVVRPDLHGPVTGVDHRQRRPGATGVQLPRPLTRYDLAGPAHAPSFVGKRPRAAGPPRPPRPAMQPYSHTGNNRGITRVASAPRQWKMNNVSPESRRRRPPD